jgi:ribosome-binding protein aMBF1 (putative translation factor)
MQPRAALASASASGRRHLLEDGQNLNMEPTTWRKGGLARRVQGVVNIAKDPQAALGRAIRLRREELAISQQDLGLEVGYDQSWVSHIENGRTNPAYGTVDRLARALGWPMSRLVALAESVETKERKPLDQPLRHEHPQQT